MNGRAAALAVGLAALVVLAGCANFDGADPWPTKGTTESTLATGTNDADGATNGTVATVVEVVDGDTVEIAYANDTRETARLLGVDTPEVHAESTPAEFEGVPETSDGVQCLRTWGDRASSFARDRLAGEQVRITFDENEGRRGGYGRLLVYVHHDGRLFNHRLVEEGYARVYDSDFEKGERFYATEDRAQSQSVGVWACRDGGTTRSG
ncbi:thermonuclease family protein [Halomicrococcus gelatinilyticus]|uniref:thermonuclease family protein n=1 Tax=Halomicrococcus gelatinilyticus TaxID=1702103 RepID=UPI002E1246DB